uniref:RING-type domain-containing protein n=1 Tax=Anopheles coluzzii TaxID=1518534 RepID=A0A8W7P5R2_ANOCL
LPDRFLCGLCQKLLREPRVLDCLHTFFRACLERVAATVTHGSGSTSIKMPPSIGTVSCEPHWSVSVCVYLVVVQSISVCRLVYDLDKQRFIEATCGSRFVFPMYGFGRSLVWSWSRVQRCCVGILLCCLRQLNKRNPEHCFLNERIFSYV